MYLPVKKSQTFEDFKVVFGYDLAVALCLQLAPMGGKIYIAPEPTPYLCRRLGELSGHAKSLCYYFVGADLWVPKLVYRKSQEILLGEVLELFNAGATWEQMCHSLDISGRSLNTYLLKAVGKEGKNARFGPITLEKQRYNSRRAREQEWKSRLLEDLSAGFSVQEIAERERKSPSTVAKNKRQSSYCSGNQCGTVG